MISREIKIEEDNANELMELTGELNLKAAVKAAIQFTYSEAGRYRGAVMSRYLDFMAGFKKEW